MGVGSLLIKVGLGINGPHRVDHSPPTLGQIGDGDQSVILIFCYFLMCHAERRWRLTMIFDIRGGGRGGSRTILGCQYHHSTWIPYFSLCLLGAIFHGRMTWDAATILSFYSSLHLQTQSNSRTCFHCPLHYFLPNLYYLNILSQNQIPLTLFH